MARKTRLTKKKFYRFLLRTGWIRFYSIWQGREHPFMPWHMGANRPPRRKKRREPRALRKRHY